MKTLAEVLNELDVQRFRLPQFFQDRGIKGTPNSCDSCPVAQYIQRETGADVVDTSDSWTEIGYVIDNVVHYHEETHPDSVREFIGDFDTGEYPELVIDELVIDTEDN